MEKKGKAGPAFFKHLQRSGEDAMRAQLREWEPQAFPADERCRQLVIDLLDLRDDRGDLDEVLSRVIGKSSENDFRDFSPEELAKAERALSERKKEFEQSLPPDPDIPF